jgi:type II secretory ATPase GspE/PulE/Tfp pilus assembly ATPase PilB-like protein
MTEKLFSTYDIAQLMQTTPGTVVEWMHRGVLPYMRLPNGPIRISQRGLSLFLKSRGLEGSGLLEAALESAGNPPDAPAGQYQPEPAEARTATLPVPATPGRIDPPVDLSDDEEFLYQPPGSPGSAELEASRPEPADQPLADQPVAEQADQDDRQAPPAAAEPPAGADRTIQARTPDPQSPPADRIAEALLVQAVARRATHIHLEPNWDELNLRLRIDGVLQPIDPIDADLPAGLGPRVAGSLLRQAGLDDKADRCASGSFTFVCDDRDVQCFVSTWPTRRGRRMTLRLLDTARSLPELAHLGLRREDQALLAQLMAEPCGLILVAGLPRSGRYTTLNAMVNKLNGPGRNIITIEKSSQYDLAGVNQSSMEAELEIELADALRAVGRQDADVVMVQELTDAPSARVAMDLARQGRLVLAGLYADSGPDAIGTLVEMGLDSWSVSKSLLAVVSPWTVRRLCEHCRQIVVPDDRVLCSLGLSRSDLTFPVFGPTGCDRCHGVGYAGRTGCFSIIEVDRKLAKVIRQDGDVASIERTALQNGTHSLGESAMEKVADGTTSLEEIARVLPHQIFVRAGS